MSTSDLIKEGKTALGIEFGSTRIKAILVDLSGNTLAEGSHTWENSLVDGVWTYSLDEIHQG
ncbi:MAG: ATPase, partial [Oscillospiraceae bacterium]|nr:ATPase [Oscillospiraceae bacterium]